MRPHKLQQVRGGNRFLQIIAGAHLHGFEIAAHIDAPGQHQNGPVAVLLLGSVQNPAPLKGWCTLAHHYQVKSFRLQAFDAGFVGGAGENLESLAFQSLAEFPQVASFLIHQKDLCGSSGYSDIMLYE
jgi:hypothetical protein